MNSFKIYIFSSLLYLLNPDPHLPIRIQEAFLYADPCESRSEILVCCSVLIFFTLLLQSCHLLIHRGRIKDFSEGRVRGVGKKIKILAHQMFIIMFCICCCTCTLALG